jgi:hypothetical protein
VKSVVQSFGFGKILTEFTVKKVNQPKQIWLNRLNAIRIMLMYDITSKYARALQREKKILPFIVDTLYRMVHVISRRGPLSLIMALPMFTAPLLSRA